MLKDCSCLSASHRLGCVNTSSFSRALRNNESHIHSYHVPILLWGVFTECSPSPGGQFQDKCSKLLPHSGVLRVEELSLLLVTIFTFLPMQNRYFSCTRQARVFMDSSHILPLSFPVIIIIGLTALALLCLSSCVLTHWVWMRLRGHSS